LTKIAEYVSPQCIGLNLNKIWTVGAAFSRDWSYVIEEFIAVESRSDSKSVLREILN